MMLKVCCVLVTLLYVEAHLQRGIPEKYFMDSIYFYGYKDNATFNFTSTSSTCSPDDLVSIIVPGWRESCSTEWVPDLISNITEFQGGCVICMDYYHFSQNGDYFALVRQFHSISDVLLSFLMELESEGYIPDNMHMFGFSFGGHLVLDSALLFGEKRIGQIDTCDMAGPGFDGSERILKDPTLAAQNVQCIHTSSDKGTFTRNCHQNWNMGRCGMWQDARGPFPKGSHGLCPYFYTSAFTHDFVAEKRPDFCPLSPRGDLTELPEYFKMGFTESRTKKAKVRGDLYATTLAEYPYNMNVDQADGETEEVTMSANDRMRLRIMNKKLIRFNRN